MANVLPSEYCTKYNVIALLTNDYIRFNSKRSLNAIQMDLMSNLKAGNWHTSDVTKNKGMSHKPSSGWTLKNTSCYVFSKDVNFELKIA